MQIIINNWSTIQKLSDKSRKVFVSKNRVLSKNFRSKFRDLGFAKTSMEGIILLEINSLYRFFERRLNQPISIFRLFNAPMVNILWNIVTGVRYDWEGPETPKIMTYGNDLVE